MRFLILAELGHGSFQRLSQLSIDGDVAQRRVPRTFAHNGEGFAVAGVIRAENDVPVGQLESVINRTCDGARVHVTGVGNNAADRRKLGLARLLSGGRAPGGESLDSSAQTLRVSRIETTSNGWLANCGGHSA